MTNKISSVLSLIPRRDNEEETELVQAQVPVKLKAEALKFKTRDKSTWDEVITACLTRYVQECKAVDE